MSTKIVYAYNAENNNVFIGEHVCQANPRRPGELLVPSSYSETDPGQIPQYKNAFFDEAAKKWKIQNDYRGATIYDTATGQPAQCDNFEIPAGYTLLPPGENEMWNGAKWVTDPEKEKAATIAAVKAELIQIDLQSIRSIREWIAAQPNAPEILKQLEDNAKTERAKMK